MDHQHTGPGGYGLRALLRADFAAFLDMDQVKAAGLSRRLDVLTQPGFHAVVLFRLANRLHRVGLKPLARILFYLNYVLFGCELYPAAEAGPGLGLAHPHGVGFGAGVRIGRDVRILQGVRLGTLGKSDPRQDGFPKVDDGCHLGDGAKVFGPVTVGAGSRIGTDVVLITSVAPRTILTLEQAHETRTVQQPEVFRAP